MHQLIDQTNSDIDSSVTSSVLGSKLNDEMKEKAADIELAS